MKPWQMLIMVVLVAAWAVMGLGTGFQKKETSCMIGVQQNRNLINPLLETSASILETFHNRNFDPALKQTLDTLAESQFFFVSAREVALEYSQIKEFNEMVESFFNSGNKLIKYKAVWMATPLHPAQESSYEVIVDSWLQKKSTYLASRADLSQCF